MIQRKQSIFLLISSILLLTSLSVAFVDFVSSHGAIRINAFSIHDNGTGMLEESMPIHTLGITLIIIAVMNALCIFLFKNRQLQIRLTRYSLILKFAILAVIGYYSYLLMGLSIEGAITPKLGIIMIVITMLLDWFTIVAIKKDEDLIRSIDRIR